MHFCKRLLNFWTWVYSIPWRHPLMQVLIRHSLWLFRYLAHGLLLLWATFSLIHNWDYTETEHSTQVNSIIIALLDISQQSVITWKCKTKPPSRNEQWYRLIKWPSPSSQRETLSGLIQMQLKTVPFFHYRPSCHVFCSILLSSAVCPFCCVN